MTLRATVSRALAHDKRRLFVDLYLHSTKWMAGTTHIHDPTTLEWSRNRRWTRTPPRTQRWVRWRYPSALLDVEKYKF